MLSTDPARLSCSLCKDIKLWKFTKFFLHLLGLLRPVSYGGHTLSGPGWLCLRFAVPTWAEWLLLQEGGGGDSGKGRNIIGSKCQHSWVGRDLIQHTG